LNCPKCGVVVPTGATFCRECGEPIKDESSEPHVTTPIAWVSPAKVAVAYAGFWLRVAAYLIDSLLVGIVTGIFILMPLMKGAGISPDNPWVLLTGQSRQILAINMLMFMASWIYFALLESSAWQATLGKRALGLLVTDLNGRRISFARASARHFAKIVSGLIFSIGFFMAGFTEKKQALHDIIASCLVLRKV
jgi:uncharacterized RDD family membrane protein YckC